MHELSIADAIVRIAEAYAQGRRVRRVDVKVGHLRQVVPSALGFAFELLAAGTAMEGAELVLVEVPARVGCHRCAAESPVDGFPLVCRRCGGFDVEVLQGEELYVDSLEVEETAVV
jgi:hydrogenase nickel incorporation protein HypA/HybF